MILLPAATKLAQGNIFTSVCQEFCPQGGGVSASVHAGIYHPPGADTPPGPDPPGADTPPDQTPQGAATHSPGPDPPPGKQTAAYGQRAAGTHPTGMHSCFSRYFRNYTLWSILNICHSSIFQLYCLPFN